MTSTRDFKNTCLYHTQNFSYSQTLNPSAVSLVIATEKGKNLKFDCNVHNFYISLGQYITVIIFMFRLSNFYAVFFKIQMS